MLNLGNFGNSAQCGFCAWYWPCPQWYNPSAISQRNSWYWSI